MKLANLKIGVRLGLLGGFFFVALLVVATGGWRALDSSNAGNAVAMQRMQALTQAIDLARSAQVEFKIQVQEWKNTLLRGNDPANFDKYSKAFVKGGESTRAELQKLNGLLAKLHLATPLVDDAIRTQNELVARYLAVLLRTAEWAHAHPDEVVSAIAAETASSEDAVRRGYGPELHRSFEPRLSDDYVHALELQKNFFRDEGFLAADIDFAAWIVHEPLRLARELAPGVTLSSITAAAA